MAHKPDLLPKCVTALNEHGRSKLDHIPTPQFEMGEAIANDPVARRALEEQLCRAIGTVLQANRPHKVIGSYGDDCTEIEFGGPTAQPRAQGTGLPPPPPDIWTQVIP